MNFESLKLGFQSYLEQKGKDTSVISNSNSNISIFMYSEDFKNYLVKEVGADVSIFTKSIDEILSMEIVNGQLVETEDSEVAFGQELTTGTETGVSDVEGDAATTMGTIDSMALSNTIIDGQNFAIDALNDILSDETVITTLDLDKSGNLSTEEINDFLSVVANGDENGDITYDNLAKSVQSIQDGTYIINKLLGNVYENETAIKALDLDNDGVLSETEKNKFEEYIKAYDGDIESLSENDIKSAFDDIISGEFSYDKDLSALEAADNTVTPDTESDTASVSPEVQSSNTASNGGTVGGGTGVGSVGNVRNSSGITNNANNSKGMTLQELETEKTKRESTLNQAQKNVEAVYSGENTAVKEAKENYEDAKEDYDEAVKNDDKISDETKQKREDNLKDIENKESEIDKTNISISQQESTIKEQESTITSAKANIQALEDALNALPSESEFSDDPEKQTEISQKRDEITSAKQKAEEQLQKDEKALEESKATLLELQGTLKTQNDELTTLENTRNDIEKEILANCSDETKTALSNFNKAKENVTTVKERELSTAKQALSAAQKDVDDINAQIDTKKAEETKKNYSVNKFDFDFETNLSSSQQSDLELFKKVWEENKDKYQAVEDATGMPAELVAALHWRESGGNFNTYLHNGDPLGQVTTHVPAGIFYTDWTEAAIDAVTNHGGSISSIDKDNIDTYYEYAERYNGLGYRNKGLPSPYVWAGTSNYSSGKYVADGVFDAGAVDQQLGVAVMLQALLS